MPLPPLPILGNLCCWAQLTCHLFRKPFLIAAKGPPLDPTVTWAGLLSLPLPGTQVPEASTRSPQWASLGYTSVVNFEALGLKVWAVADTPSPHPPWHWQVCAQRAGEAQVSPNPALIAPGPRNCLPLAFPPLPSLIWPASLGWHCPLDPFPHRRAQLKRCLEQLKQQMPLGADCARYTTLSLLRRARMHIQKLEEQEQRARRLKEKLRSKQQSLRQQLEQLRGLAGAGERERLRADSLDSSGLSSERSDSDQEELEVDVESLVFGGEAELLRGFSAGQEHSYSHSSSTWL
nr:max dimerization protein 3 isoform X1 [Globicephala melas]